MTCTRNEDVPTNGQESIDEIVRSLWTAVLKTGLHITLIGWSMRQHTATARANPQLEMKRQELENIHNHRL